MESALHQLSGGKGANLSKLVQAGFQVPAGFVVTTRAYEQFLVGGGVHDRLAVLTVGIDDDPQALEANAGAIREAVLSSPIPEHLIRAIESAYRDVGDGAKVAVRSSGTAEDLADASFAGQHDTYLDVSGAGDVVEAVRRCWASLWTARAVAYRARHGFEHLSVQLAVVVQTMARSEVSGVMFTANPLTTATDETVINATWGLGEALVQGIVTPDQFVVEVPSFAMLEQTMGEKSVRIVGDGAVGQGVATESVPDSLRDRFCLDGDQVRELARLGQRVQTSYRGFPQDIEWALEDGEFYLLQARPITGVEFSWDSDVDLCNRQDVASDAIWTRMWADSLTTGVVCPLTYSVRYPMFSSRHLSDMWEIFGLEQLSEMRTFKYWKGEVYFNVETETVFVEKLVPPAVRPMFLDFIPVGMREKTLDAPFDEGVLLRSLTRWHLLDPDSTPTGFLKVFEKWRNRTDYEGLSHTELRELTDEEVIAYCRRMVELEGEWGDVMLRPLMITLRLLMSGLAWMITSWYDGGPPEATFAKLVAGAPRRTDTQHESADMAALVLEIRQTPTLLAALEQGTAEAFFDSMPTFAEGRRFLGKYQQWIAKWGHRGHADRDMIYPRRADDRSLDYRAFKVLVGSGGSFNVGESERALAEERDKTFAEVVANVASKPHGAAKAEAIQFAFSLTHEYLMIRDDERARPTDVIMYAYKRGFDEIGRRLYARNQIDEARDFHFLSEEELYQLFRALVENLDLLRAKIGARRRDCDRMLQKTADLPTNMQRNRPVDLEHPVEAALDGTFVGTPTSPGATTGRARVLADHSEMGSLLQGEILVTHSTDPGWNPVFTLISAVVVETGGMLSHASCLAREYGFPAVHLPGATKLLETGATITVDGNLGTVRIEQ
jgi:pyruvate,water dikinase